MNLSGGDTIEIRTVENGVLLSKYKSASAGDRSMKKYLNILYSVTRCGAAICTEDQVIVSKGLCVMERLYLKPFRIISGPGNSRYLQSRFI